VIAGMFVGAVALIERRLEWRALVFPLLGIVVGLVVNPYLPNDIWFIPEHYLGKAEISAAMHVGSEWYPYAFAASIGWSGPLAVLAGAAVVAWQKREDLDANRLALLLIGAVFFCLMRRTVCDARLSNCVGRLAGSGSAQARTVDARGRRGDPPSWVRHQHLDGDQPDAAAARTGPVRGLCRMAGEQHA